MNTFKQAIEPRYRGPAGSFLLSGLQQNGGTEGYLMAFDVTVHVSFYGLPPHFLVVRSFRGTVLLFVLVPFPEPEVCSVFIS